MKRAKKASPGLNRMAKRAAVSPRLVEKVVGTGKRRERPGDPFLLPDRIEMTYHYSHGGVSRFFRELRDHARLLGSRCAACQKVYLPPRSDCSVCLKPTTWVPVGPGGKITAATVVYFATSRFFRRTPFVCAYIRLDGADTSLLHNVVAADVTKVKPGTRVRAVFHRQRIGEMADFHFVPEKRARA